MVRDGTRILYSEIKSRIGFLCIVILILIEPYAINIQKHDTCVDRDYYNAPSNIYISLHRAFDYSFRG